MKNPSSSETAAGQARVIPLRVLLAGSPADAERIVRELRRADFAPDCTHAETEAQYLACITPDLDVVLADARVGDLEAPVALDHLRERGFEVPFILVSGAMHEETVAALMRQGAADHVLEDHLVRLGPAVRRALAERERRTARERAERELRESEERFRLLVESAEEYAIVMLDTDGRVVSWNPAAERLYGWRAEEIVGETVARFHAPEEVGCGGPEHELEVAATEGRFEDQGWRVRKDGTRFWADVVMSALHHPTGELRGFAKITRDASERRRMEEALARQGHELARADSERAALASAVIRELSEPLARIEGALRDLAARPAGDVDAETRDAACRGLEAAAHMKAALEKLLSRAREGEGGTSV